ncbi:MAG: PDDEXK nuclease domain-containing protein [Crocinitomicaceae bacterium]|nr:PDDEXK nuclease domain-containing protein [Crocinitomicaceae bacterium]
MNRGLNHYVVVELKATEFDAGHISKLNMYMNVVDDVLRHPDDKKTLPSIEEIEKELTNPQD